MLSNTSVASLALVDTLAALVPLVRKLYGAPPLDNRQEWAAWYSREVGRGAVRLLLGATWCGMVWQRGGAGGVHTCSRGAVLVGR